MYYHYYYYFLTLVPIVTKLYASNVNILVNFISLFMAIDWYFL